MVTISANQLRRAFKMARKNISISYGLVLVLFPLEGKSGLSHYRSDVPVRDTIKVLRATADALERGTTLKPLEEN